MIALALAIGVLAGFGCAFALAWVLWGREPGEPERLPMTIYTDYPDRFAVGLSKAVRRAMAKPTPGPCDCQDQSLSEQRRELLLHVAELAVEPGPAHEVLGRILLALKWSGVVETKPRVERAWRGHAPTPDLGQLQSAGLCIWCHQPDRDHRGDGRGNVVCPPRPHNDPPEAA